MADINKIDLTDVQDSLQGTYQAIDGFQLTTYSADSVVTLASGRVEEIGDYTYRVEDGDLAVTVGSVSDGTVYVIVLDDGDGTATAKLTDETIDETNWDANKAGYYINTGANDGAKVLFAMTKSGTTYSNKGRLLAPLDQQRAIGEIFAIHPDTKILPNPFNFLPCDAVGSLTSNFIDTSNDTKVPDIDDDRFLKGGTAFDKDASGVNNHNHQWYDYVNATSYNSSGSAGSGMTRLPPTGTSGPNTLVVESIVSNGFLGADYYTNKVDHIPKYFEVLYYIRIR